MCYPIKSSQQTDIWSRWLLHSLTNEKTHDQEFPQLTQTCTSKERMESGNQKQFSWLWKLHSSQHTILEKDSVRTVWVGTVFCVWVTQDTSLLIRYLLSPSRPWSNKGSRFTLASGNGLKGISVRSRDGYSQFTLVCLSESSQGNAPARAERGDTLQPSHHKQVFFSQST